MSDQTDAVDPAFDQASPDFYQALARAVRLLRVERDLERRDLAERAGLAYSYLSEIETGKKRPSSKSLLAIAQALGVRTHELIALAETLAQRATSWTAAETLPAATAAPLEEAEALAAPASPAEPAADLSAPACSRFFHAPSSPPAQRRQAEPVQPAAGGSSLRPSPPRSLSAVLSELRELLARLAPEDIERVLDLARRLSR